MDGYTRARVTVDGLGFAPETATRRAKRTAAAILALKTYMAINRSKRPYGRECNNISRKNNSSSPALLPGITRCSLMHSVSVHRAPTFCPALQANDATTAVPVRVRQEFLLLPQAMHREE